MALTDTSFHGIPEFRRIDNAIAAKVERASLPQLSETKKMLLARKANLTEAQVRTYARAEAFANRTKLTTEVAYALLQDHPDADFSSILTAKKNVLRSRLERAITDNLVSPAVADGMDDTLTQLRDLAVDDLLADNSHPHTGNIAALLATTRLSEAQKRTFLSAHLDNDTAPATFWAQLRQNEDFDDTAVDELQLTIQLGTLTLNHAPLVNAIKTQRRVTDASELAGLDVADWLGLLDGLEAPIEFDGEAARQTYAQTIVSLVAKAYPTARLLSKWGVLNEPDATDIGRFFTSNPGFEFRDTSVGAYLATHPTALDKAVDRETLRHNLEGMHRLFSVVPDDDKFEPVCTLWQDGLRSAHAIVHLGEGGFTRRFSQTIGEREASRIYALARHKTAFSLATLVKYAPAFNGWFPMILGELKIAEAPDEIPDWHTLFGSLDYCECRHCRSILSPAAYFVDLLQFLTRADAGDPNALEALLARRPDLAHILLDCDNTNTAMPYIDLVNELLENAVVNGLTSLAGAPGLQTTVTSEALRANPEHIDPAAYNQLAAATFPWSLPFDLWHEERQVYLGHLGIRVWELMDVLHREGQQPVPVDRAAAYFGMTPTERAIIVGEAGGHELGTTNAVLVLMRRSQTTFEDLRELLTSRFINPSAKAIVFAEGSCALEDATLVLTNEERDRLHRFRRLQIITDYTVFELDLVLETLSSNGISNDFLIQLAFFDRLKKRFRCAVPELLGWWTPIGMKL